MPLNLLQQVLVADGDGWKGEWIGILYPDADSTGVLVIRHGADDADVDK